MNENQDFMFKSLFQGLPGFYTSFCSTLYNELDKEVPVWVIGKFKLLNKS